jgi:hypothetical protein
MESTFTVRVTRDLIAHALEQTSTMCAVAVALKAADEDIVRPRVTQTTIAFTDARSGKRYVFDTPDKIAKFIDAFDRGRELARPFNFGVDLDGAKKVKEPKHRSVQKAIDQAQRDRDRRSRGAKSQVYASARALRHDITEV